MIQLIKANSSIFLFLVIGLVIFNSPIALSKGQDKKTVVKQAHELYRPSDMVKKKDASKVKNLRRVDFRLKGSNCGSCLGRIRKRMAKLDAVLDAAVCIKKPYGGVALYDGDKIKVDKLLEAGLKNEKVKVEILDVNDRKIDKPPFVLFPDINQLSK